MKETTYPCDIAIETDQIEELICVGSVMVHAVDHHDSALWKPEKNTWLVGRT